MGKKKWTILEIQEKVQKYENWKEKGTFPFLKKVLGLKKEMSFDELRSRKTGLALFNRIYGTNYRFIYSQIGESLLYEVTDVIESNGQRLLI
ncbi:MAG: hypothetical protein PHC89_02685 [Candidatus Pacebacteria bacterium]|nr:hypothetical protein [Candidatus Paceibacterota bacterium]